MYVMFSEKRTLLAGIVQEYEEKRYCDKSKTTKSHQIRCVGGIRFEICENSPNVTGSTCAWLVEEDDVANKLAQQRMDFYVLRFFIFFPVALIVLLLSFHPKAKEHLAEDRCFGFKLRYRCFSTCTLVLQLL